MFFPPFVIKFAPSNYGMVLCMMQFIIVNPIYSIVIGIISGRNIRTRWSFPLISAITFVFGVSLSFGLGEPDFIIYTGIYLIIGVFTMLITTLIKHRACFIRSRRDFEANVGEHLSEQPPH